MSDLIERDKAMKVAMWFGRSEQKYSQSFIKKRVMEIPSARPREGTWIEVEWYPIAVPSKWCENDEKPIYASKLQCSKCGFTRNFLDGHTAQYNFCPSCGADMRGGRADEHGRNKSADRQ